MASSQLSDVHPDHCSRCDNVYGETFHNVSLLDEELQAINGSLQSENQFCLEMSMLIGFAVISVSHTCMQIKAKLLGIRSLCACSFGCACVFVWIIEIAKE